jgi:N-acetylglucosamine-6-phosphate deacetylase
LPDGTLLGATALLDRALANVVSLGIPVERAVSLVTSIPADVIGLSDHGRLQPGARADVVALDPTSMAVRHTWIGGELAA